MDFNFFLEEGLYHISDLTGYDHILFVLAMCLGCTFGSWKRLTVLVTAFTIGHSVALTLATTEVVHVSYPLVEFLIPITIMGTCLYNILSPIKRPATKNEESLSVENKRSLWELYAVVTFFGLIHGLGFSNHIRDMLVHEEGLFFPLLAFNIGLEIGQLLIVAVALALNFLFLSILKIRPQLWNLFMAGNIHGIALILAIERVGFLV